MLVFVSQFFGFFWGGFFLFICVWKVGCFCVSCFWFSFWCWFCFCLFALFCGWMLLFLFLFFVCFSCFFCFFLCFFFCFFVFFGGFKGQVRWSEGLPHLALNPPYFLVFVFSLLFFVFLFVFLFLFFLEGLRVRRGGPKGHLTWP